MKISTLSIFLLLFSFIGFGQKMNYPVSAIADSLKQNANAVKRLDEMNINITSQKLMVIKSTVVTTVLNEFGMRILDLSEGYDKNRKIIKIEARAYDALGKELKVYKRKDFKDVSVTDGGTIFDEHRALYLDYTPITYPFTMVVEKEVETSNTAFIPWWSPKDQFFTSTESASFSIAYKP